MLNPTVLLQTSPTVNANSTVWPKLVQDSCVIKELLLTLGITNVNVSLLLIGCDDYGEELNKNIIKFVHHFIDSTGRL